jgi:hypothetical protein
MSEMSELVERMILGRYHKSVWGYMPFPRKIPKIGNVSLPNLKVSHSVSYSALWRFRERRKPLGWPVGSHGTSDVEAHVEMFLGPGLKTDLVVCQAWTYVRAHQNGLPNLSSRFQDGARAFREFWFQVNERFRVNCHECESQCANRERRSVEKVAQLDGII